MGKDLNSSKTQWSLIVRAQGEGPQARAALGQLLQRYERTILSMIRYFRHPPDQTPDEVKQEFFTRLLERRDISALDRGKGTFRSWLRRAVKNHLSNAWDSWNADKNPARRTDYPEAFEATSGESAEQLLIGKLAADTLDHVTAQLRGSASSVERFDALSELLPRVSPGLALLPPTQPSPRRTASLAASLGMTPTGLNVAIHRLRAAFQRRLDEAVADILDVDLAEPARRAEVEREKRLLFGALCDAPGCVAHLQTG